MTRPTMLLLQSLTSSGIRMFALLLTMTTAALAGVTVYFPVSGSTVTSPVHIRAAAASTYPITYTRIYVDNVSVWGSAVSRFNTYLNMKAGNHYVVVHVHAPIRRVEASGRGTPLLEPRRRLRF